MTGAVYVYENEADPQASSKGAGGIFAVVFEPMHASIEVFSASSCQLLLNIPSKTRAYVGVTFGFGSERWRRVASVSLRVNAPRTTDAFGKLVYLQLPEDGVNLDKASNGGQGLRALCMGIMNTVASTKASISQIVVAMVVAITIVASMMVVRQLSEGCDQEHMRCTAIISSLMKTPNTANQVCQLAEQRQFAAVRKEHQPCHINGGRTVDEEGGSDSQVAGAAASLHCCSC